MFLAILTGFLIYMVSGMIYYSILGKRWVNLLHIKLEKQPNYGLLTFVTLLTTLLLFGLLNLSQAETLVDGALIGGSVGLIVALAYAKDFIFSLGSNSKNAISLYFIAVGYHVIALTVIGTVMMFFI
ncbi:DUF1761 domain-containing protein [Alkalihalobacterium chitinilyticum]|uniref:DUF1761 domain-containing protein n=1 Tax=Alkalihalobacterium chitinilyticum TaxID=2980103 RepID=A0ABT5VCM7_9BACI|nr:DUF1761 domain-containing protein [Alkalihalobacterium chitinilyticum]MDE5413195.1 DUF1761 domain-containing protein [Alkalihalobacterium chitinilyticum]